MSEREVLWRRALKIARQMDEQYAAREDEGVVARAAELADLVIKIRAIDSAAERRHKNVTMDLAVRVQRSRAAMKEWRKRKRRKAK